ncbi:hypothetical protein ABZ871_21075 [Streptomyces populi]
MVPMADDGFTVFAVPEPLCVALAAAEGDRFRVTALVRTGAATEPDGEISPENAVDLLQRLSALAGSRAEKQLALYCWYFAP